MSRPGAVSDTAVSIPQLPVRRGGYFTHFSKTFLWSKEYIIIKCTHPQYTSTSNILHNKQTNKLQKGCRKLSKMAWKSTKKIKQSLHKTPNFLSLFRDIAPCVSATRVAAISQPAGVCDMITRDPVPGWQLSASAVISPTHGSCLSLATLPPFLFLGRPLFLGTKWSKHLLTFKSFPIFFLLQIVLLNLDKC